MPDTPTPADIELPAHTCRLSGIESDLLRKYAEAFALAAILADRARTAASCAVPVPHATIAGALFDFLGFLTSHERRWAFSSRDDAGPAVEALQEWADKRSLSLAEADVGNWLAPATVRAAEPAASCAGWMPIETAPKDGRARLVWCPERKNTYCVTWLQDRGWQVFGGFMLSEEPTHWQPSPPAPGAPATVRAERTDAASVADTLESYNRWRRGNADGLEQPHPALIGEAIDRAVAMLRADVPEGCTPADARKLREANHALALELDRLHEDAEDADRYRWLRNRANALRGDAPQVVITDCMGVPVSTLAWAYPKGNDLDTAIDAARAVPAPTAGDAGGAA